jgi:dihydrofolate synthase/folylpolyglutamate synthase
LRFKTLEEWLEWQEQLHTSEIELGLERADSVYSGLVGEKNRPFTITIAGTNGKGSTAVFLENILLSAGYSVGCYSSPHLIRYNERVRLQALPVSDVELCKAFQAIDEVRGVTSLSYFEFGTIAALQIFSQAEVDIQILEVGLGGRLDAINIVDADISIITSIGIDHCDWLGDTREEIGFEKAGIFRALRPAISGEPDLPNTVINHAEKIGAFLRQFELDFNYQKKASYWNWESKSKKLDNLPLLKLEGEQQLRNASTALAAIELLPATIPVDEEAIRNGLATAQLPGRLQWLGGEHKILLDVSHNPESAKVLAQYLENRASKGKVFALFSFMKDKDIEAILEFMFPVVDSWQWVALSGVVRAANRKQIETAFTNCGLPKPNVQASDLVGALDSILQKMGPNDCIVIFGSFYLASEVLKLVHASDEISEKLLPQV